MFVILSVKVRRLGKMNTDVVLDLLANIRHSVAMTLCDIMTCPSRVAFLFPQRSYIDDGGVRHSSQRSSVGLRSGLCGKKLSLTLPRKTLSQYFSQ